MLGIALLIWASGAVASASRPPLAVRDYISELKGECEQQHAEPVERPGLVTPIDLNGDGLLDYLVNVGGLDCKGAYSLWSGAHGGLMIVIFVSRPDGTSFRAFDGRAYDLTIERKGVPPRVYLDVGGRYCGQDTTGVAFADMWACRRPLDWKPATQTFEFAPLDQVSRLRGPAR